MLYGETQNLLLTLIANLIFLHLFTIVIFHLFVNRGIQSIINT